MSDEKVLPSLVSPEAAKRELWLREAILSVTLEFIKQHQEEIVARAVERLEIEGKVVVK